MEGPQQQVTPAQYIPSLVLTPAGLEDPVSLLPGTLSEGDLMGCKEAWPLQSPPPCGSP